MKGECPQCGTWTDDDWTSGPFGLVCWPCFFATRAIGRALAPGTVEFVQLGRMLSHAYRGAGQSPVAFRRAAQRLD